MNLEEIEKLIIEETMNYLEARDNINLYTQKSKKSLKKLRDLKTQRKELLK